MNRRTLLSSAFLAAALALPSFAQEAKPATPETPAKASGKTVRLLNIGNSFSGNATRYLKDLVKAGGHILIHRQASIGGSSMQVHWDKAMLAEKNSADPAGLYGTKLNLSQELQKEPWDYVTIQQASIKSHDLATYQPYAGQLAKYVKKHAPKAQLLVHETWAYRVDDPRFAVKEPKAGEPRTQDEMYDMLSKAYRTISAELKAPIIPTGDAFKIVASDAKWAFVPDKAFDSKAAKNPELPVQKNSLHTGWNWKKQKDGKITLGMDGHHANAAGQYLGGCVFYEILFKESVVGNSFIPKEIDPEFARYLQTVAHQAVEANLAREKGARSE